MSLGNLKSDLRKVIDKEKAEIFPRFFKTGKGEYGEGDKFIGVTVPNCRLIAKKYKGLNLSDIERLLKSKIHEERLVALLVLVAKYQKADNELKKNILSFYLKNTKYINNWDLVDLTCHKIVGDYLLTNPDAKIIWKNKTFKGNDLLKTLAKSKNLWERRIAIVSTFANIRDNDLKKSVKISEMLLSDKHDLIHKAVGWALREVGKKDVKLLEKFLKENYSQIPRTALRYAIERFPKAKRQKYLKGNIK